MLIYQLWIPPITGIADNGDFARLFAPFGLEHASPQPADRYFDYVAVRYRQVRPPDLWAAFASFRSSETIPIALALALNTLASKTGEFDIRLMGTVHACLFLLLILLFEPLLPANPRWLRWLLSAAALFVFADVAYVSYFNTFYSEPAVFLSLLGLIGFFLHALRAAVPPRWVIAGLVACACLFVTSKSQIAISAPLVAALVWFVLRKSGPVRYAAPGAVVVLALCSLWFYPTQYRKVNLFMTVFGGVVPESGDPKNDLAALGLEPSMVSYQNTAVWSPEVNIEGPYLEEHLFQRTSYARVVWFYVTRPSRMAALISRGIQESFHLNSKVFGQLEKFPGVEPKQKNRAFAIWSGLREWLQPFWPWVAILVCAIFAALVWSTASLPLRCLQFFLGVLAVSQLFIAVIGEGPADLSKHLFVFNVCLDVLLFWAFAAGLNASLRYNKRK